MKDHCNTPFSLAAISNNTIQSLILSINSIGKSSNKIDIKVEIKKDTTFNLLDLQFGPQEAKDFVPPLGYHITLLNQSDPCKHISLEFDHSEDPLADISLNTTNFIVLPYIYYWSLYCNNYKLKTFQSSQGQCTHYNLTISDQELKIDEIK